jgi:hypothetical protein
MPAHRAAVLRFPFREWGGAGVISEIFKVEDED